MVEESNKELEEWANQMHKDFERYVEAEDKRMKELGLIFCVVFKDKMWDYGINLASGSFKIKKEELRDFIYKDKIECYKQDEEFEFLNRTYKFMYMESEHCAMFYRDY